MPIECRYVRNRPRPYMPSDLRRIVGYIRRQGYSTSDVYLAVADGDGIEADAVIRRLMGLIYDVLDTIDIIQRIAEAVQLINKILSIAIVVALLRRNPAMSAALFGLRSIIEEIVDPLNNLVGYVEELLQVLEPLFGNPTNVDTFIQEILN